MPAEVVKTPKFVARYAHVIRSRAYAPKGRQPAPDAKKYWSVDGTFPRDSEFAKRCQQICRETLAKKFGRVPDRSCITYVPLKDASKVKNVEEEGSIYVRFKRRDDGQTNPPQVVGPNPKNKITDPRDAYSGMICIVGFHAYAWGTPDECGVTFELDMLQKVGKGEPIGYVTPEAVEVFETFVGSDVDSDADPNAIFGDDDDDFGSDDMPF